jgi:hypothetical protein
MITISPDELTNRAFQLAYFLHGERTTAIEIAARALNKLQLAATAQGRRLYYRLTGRPDARKARSKVSLGEPHLLQRLVYVESEQFERLREAAAQATGSNGAIPIRQSDLVVFFIKHLVRITTKRNSFYVTLGLSRLLYNYSTAETMEIYNLVIQDPDRVHDDYYYRSRKVLLLKELKERFGELVEVAKGPRGEQRWRAAKDSSQHASLVRECLHWFTPWATPCAVPEALDPFNDTIDQLTFQGRLPDEEHEVEVNRIHAALHPECFARLAAAHQLERPEAKLELPHFFLNEDADRNDDQSRTPPNLAADELRIINDLLAQEALRRKAVAAGFLRVLVDGIQMALIEAGNSATSQFSVNDEAEVIEVYSQDQKGPLLLATHLLNFNRAATQNLAVTVEGGQRISFTVEPLREDQGTSTGARVTVAIAKTSFAAAASVAARRIFGFASEGPKSSVRWWKLVSEFAVVALLIAGAWWAWTSRQNRTEIVRVTPTPAPTVPMVNPTPGQQKGQEQQGVTSPPDIRSPEIKTTPTATPTWAQRQPQPREAEDTFVARSLVASDSTSPEPGEFSTRGAWNRDSMGKRLSEVRKIYFQPLADNQLTREVLSRLQSSLVNTALTNSGAADADAALKITAQPASARAGEARVAVVVRVVNANGYVIWPDSRRSSSWRYVGYPRFVAERIVKDLAGEVQR